MILLWVALSLSGLFLWILARVYGAREARRIRLLIRVALIASAALLVSALVLRLQTLWAEGCSREELIPWMGLFVLQAGGLCVLVVRLYASARKTAALKVVARARGTSGAGIGLEVLLSPDVTSPFLWSGLRSARIYFPIMAWSALSERDRALVLAHEEGHHRGKDSGFRIFLEVLIPLFAFHPILFLLRQELALLDEYLADDFALAQEAASPAELVRGFIAWTQFEEDGIWPAMLASSHLLKRSQRLTEALGKCSLGFRGAAMFITWSALFFPPALVESKILEAPPIAPEFLGLKSESRDGSLYALLSAAGVFVGDKQARDICPALNGGSK